MSDLEATTGTTDNTLRFDLALVEIPVEMKDPTTGDLRRFVLRELDGAGRDKYLNGLQSRMKHDKEGKVVGIQNFSGLQSDLLVLCMKEKTSAGEEPVKMAWLQSLPSNVLSQLHRKAKDISALDEKAEDEAGND